MNPNLAKLLTNVSKFQGTPNPKLYIKFVHPTVGWIWYISEYNPKTEKCYGYIKAVENEWGYFTIKDLSSVGALFDSEFKPIRFNDLIKGKEVE